VSDDVTSSDVRRTRSPRVRALGPFVTGYRAWLDKQEARLGSDIETALYAPARELAHRDAHRGVEDGQAQLRFFPTGGGKTEVYLGLTAYMFAIHRLRGVARDDHSGA
jgi:hypothetical protein